MKILVSGSTGLIGSHLVPFLTAGGHEVLRLVRREARHADEIQWDPMTDAIDSSKLEGVDAVVHLAGEGIAKRRWSRKQKQRIEDSRVIGTQNLLRALGRMKQGPKTFVGASAIGFYGNRGDEILDERSGTGTGFLAEVCKKWEEVSSRASAQGMRCVLMRLGVVLSARGGALAKMLPPFKFGAGGPLGSGNQWMSWVALDDVVGALHHALMNADMQGTLNLVAPNPVTNRHFGKTLGRVLKRPAIAPFPSFAAKLIFGEMGEELLLASARVLPRHLIESGFQFEYPELEGALRHLLGRPDRRAVQAAKSAVV